MNIQKIWGEKVYDSRKQETIRVYVKTNLGTWSTSSPSGNSTGRYEVPAFVKNVISSIAMLKEMEEKIKEIELVVFNDLEKVEKIIDKNKIGANTLYALEASILKALAYENKQELWQMINPNAKRFPHPVGNIIGGGKHAQLTNGKKPDFQEFLIIPKMRKFSESVNVMKKAHELAGDYLEARKAKGILDDEGAWSTSLGNSECLEVINSVRKDIEQNTEGDIEIGIDIAASTFYSPDIYHYAHSEVFRSSKEQIDYVSGLADKFEVFYIEDPVDEDDFKNFRVFRGKNAGRMTVGDDLTVSNEERFLKALKEKAIDAVILKPNQTGSLLEIKKIVYLAKKYNIALVMSHRAGETMDSTIADLAFGFQCDYIKAGAYGQEREIKLRRLIEIENKIKK